MNFDLNLVPFIDVLSTCICFLLITAVFMQLGTVNVRQAIGDGAASSKKEQPSVWVKLIENGAIEVDVKNVKSSRASRFVVQGKKSSPDFSRFEQSIGTVKKTYPELNVALIMPAAQSRYADLIRVMDVVKKGDIAQVGIAPL
ncbi:MAG: ExbD/TolR family protein [Bdellovibrionales bacterium]